MAKNPDEPTRIEGKIISVDGQEVQFSIDPGLGWQQWGNIQEVCYRNVELLDALAQATGDHLQDEIEDDEED